MPRILAVAVTLLAVLSVGAVAEAQKYRTPGKFWVRDANNKKVGVVIDFYNAEGDVGADFVVVAASLDNSAVALGVTRDEFTCGRAGSNICSSEVFFESTDCTGMPLLQVGMSDPGLLRTLTAEAVVSGPGVTLYHAPEPGVPTGSRTVRSRYDGTNSACQTGFQADLSDTVLALTFGLGAAFTPPFRVTPK